MRVLITGFGPFGDFPANPAAEAVHLLAARGIDRIELATEVLPVDFRIAPARIAALVEEHAPDLVLAVGVAGRDVLTIERVAVNLIDARIADVTGNQPVDVPVVEDGPAALFSTLPVKAMAAAVRNAGIPCELSLSAGSYVCNAVMYAALHTASTGTRAGFLHVPPAHVLAPAEAARAMAIAITTALRTETDAVHPEGRED